MAGPPPGTPPPGPPPGLPPPAAGPTGYQSPYYAPTGPAVQGHRTPWTLIIAGGVALLVLMAGCATPPATIGKRNPSNPSGVGTADVPQPPPARGTPTPA